MTLTVQPRHNLSAPLKIRCTYANQFILAMDKAGIPFKEERKKPSKGFSPNFSA